MPTWERRMADTLIQNPILNSPYREPNRHWRFSDEGILNEIAETRRASAYFVQIPAPKKKGKQLQFETEWTQDRIEPNDKANLIREKVKHWREGEYQGVTQVTRKLLQHWINPDRENKLFFCQVEALETLVLPAPRPRSARPDRAARPGEDPDHQLSRLQAPQAARSEQADQADPRLSSTMSRAGSGPCRTARRFSFRVKWPCSTTSETGDGRPGRSRS